MQGPGMHGCKAQRPGFLSVKGFKLKWLAIKNRPYNYFPPKKFTGGGVYTYYTIITTPHRGLDTIIIY